MSGYPVSYRTGAKTTVSRATTTAFKESRTVQRLVNLPPLAPQDVFQREAARKFGRRTAAQLGQQLAEMALRKAGKRIIYKILPILGEGLLLKDGFELAGEIIKETLRTVPEHYIPGDPVEVGPHYYRVGWRRQNNNWAGVSPDGNITVTEVQDFDVYEVPGGQYYDRSWTDMNPVNLRYGFGSTWPLSQLVKERKIHLVRYPGTPVGDEVDRYVQGEIWTPDENAEPDPRYGISYEPGEPVLVPEEVVTETQRIPIYEEGEQVATPSLIERGYGETVEEGKTRYDVPLSVMPALIIQVGAHTVIPGHHVVAPPPSATKERKAVMGRAAAAIVSAIAHGTEFADGVGAFWKTLPDEFKTGYVRLHGKKHKVYYKKRRQATPQEMIADLYKHWEDANLKEAIQNLAENEIQDKLIGHANQRLHKAAKPWYDKTGRPVGFSTGPAL